MERKIIIKYGELWLKSEPVKRRFIGRLCENVRSSLKRNGVENFRLARTRDMLVLEADGPGMRKAAALLRNVFGISTFAEAFETAPELEAMEKAALELAKRIGKGQTFAIRASRQDKSLPFTSKDIEIAMAANIDRKVNLSGPDVTIFVEARKGKAYVYSEKIRGAGGLPYGVSGRVLSLISGGIDSPVASWLMMKRGCEAHFVYFYPELFTGQKSVEVVKKAVGKLREFAPKGLVLHVVPFSDIQKSLAESCDRKMTCVLCRRAMYRTAQAIAAKAGCKALVTGENLAQVASQTLDNLFAETEALQMPIFRPVIGMDKEDIISLSKKIGTYDISIETGCCTLSPKKPATRARLEDVLAAEKRINDLGRLIGDAAGSAEVAVI